MLPGKTVVDVLISIGKWVAKNPVIIKDAADAVVKLKPSKNSKDAMEPSVDDKLNQLGEAVLEIDEKFNSEIIKLNKDLHIMKILLSIIGGLLSVAIIAFILIIL